MRFAIAFFTATLAGLGPAQTPDVYDINTVRDWHLQFNQPNWWSLLLQNYASGTNIPADLRVDNNVTVPNVGVRFRGNSSYFQLPAGSEKKSFNIESDFYVPGQDLWGYEHFNLNNGFHDPTFIREFLTYWAMRQHGPAPLCNFVRLHLNGIYWGIYINVQQPNRGMMDLWWRSDDGNRYRGFPTSGSFANGRTALTWLGSDVNQYLLAYQAKRGDGTDLMQMINVLNNTPQAQLQSLLPAEFSVDQFYRYAATMNVFGQTDSYIGSGKDHFLYHDPVHGDFHVFPFDLNEAMAGSTSLDPWYNTTSTIKPAFSKTIVFPDWRQRYKAHVRSIVEQTFNVGVLDPMIRRYHALLDPMVAADTKKIYSYQLFRDNLTMSVNLRGVGGNTIPGLLPYVAGREAFLRNHVDLSPPRTALSDLRHTPASPNAQQTVTVTVRASSLAAAVKLWWRRLGPYASTAMFDDGLHGDGGPNDGVWGAFIAPQASGSLVDYYVEATTSTGLATYLPHTAEHAAGRYLVAWPTGTSPIRINEFVAQNVNGIVDEASQHEDWLELYNDSAAPVNVGGMWVTDDITRPKFQIPANFAIPARGTMLIWCDEDRAQGPLHANFKLSANGEEIALFAADGQTLLDHVVFGEQVADVSTGRVLDGALPWATFRVPTPYARNELPGCGTRAYGGMQAWSHSAALALNGPPRIGTAPPLAVTGGPPFGAAGLMLALAPAQIDLAAFGVPGEALLLDPVPLLIGPIYVGLDGQGSTTLPLSIPPDQSMVGAAIYAQVITSGGSGVDMSNAIAIVICP